MALQFPLTEGKAVDFTRCEIDLNGKIYTAISNISGSQPIEEGVPRGTRAEPLARTRGSLQIGDGEIEWSMLEEAFQFIADLGDGWQEKVFTATKTYTTDAIGTVKVEYFGCRILDTELDHSEGSDALGATMPFSFLSRKVNGKKALIDQLGL